MIQEPVTFGGLWVIGNALWIGAPEARRRARIAPEGVVLVHRGAHDLLPWDDGFTGEQSSPAAWWAYGTQGGRYQRAKVTIARGGGSDRWWQRRDRFELHARWASMSFAIHDIPALLVYLCATEEARPGLLDQERLIRLIHDLWSQRWRAFWTVGSGPAVASFGTRRRIDQAIERVLARRWPRRWSGRPFAGEWVPTPEELFHPVRRALPAQLRARVGDDLIERRISRAVRARPWPFAALTT